MASPRPSASLVRSPPSSRTSLDTTSQPSSFSRATNPQTRRNRAALRDYYGLRTQNAESIQSPIEQSRSSSVEPSQREISAENVSSSRLYSLDQEGFDAGSYVRQLMETEALGGLLALENELVADIRTLDGERKALVYDNYSKLITATDTIKKMRSNMDPLSPSTSTLSPAIAHIAETAASLAEELNHTEQEDSSHNSTIKSQARKVQWVLETPERVERLFASGRRQEALDEWSNVQQILHRWKSPEGTESLKQSCQAVIDNYTLETDDSDD